MKASAYDCTCELGDSSWYKHSNTVTVLKHCSSEVTLWEYETPRSYGLLGKSSSAMGSVTAHCDPPMEHEELDTIWNSAIKFVGRFQQQNGYVDPDSYNEDFARGSLKHSDYSDIGQAKVLAREYGDELN